MVRKEEVLARTSNGLDVFRHYLPVKWRVGRNFLNPLYADSKASCNVYYDRRSGTYRMKDFGNGDYSGDCFFLVAKLKGLDCRNAADFVEVLHTIDRELCLGLDGDSPTDGTVGTGGCRRLRLVPGARGGGAGEAGTDTEEAAVSADRPEPKPYRAAEKPFTEGELVYWGASGITVEVLRRYGTVSLAEYRGETREGKAFGFSPTRRKARGNGRCPRRPDGTRSGGASCRAWAFARGCPHTSSDCPSSCKILSETWSENAVCLRLSPVSSPRLRRGMPHRGGKVVVRHEIHFECRSTQLAIFV